MSNSTPIAVPPGWIYTPNDDNSARYVLGTVGSNPLICFGVNPSTAAPGNLDHTLRRVQGHAERNGYDSWVMFNVYPQRATDPSDMHLAHDPALKMDNERHIADFINNRQLTLLAAWGKPITSRPYLSTMLRDIVTITDASGCDWVRIGDLTTSRHPRHPSRGAYTPLQQFDMSAYLQRLDP